MGTTDCCFTKDDEWFRYRTAAIIVEEGSVLFVRSSGCDYLYTVGGGVHVNETSEECIKREVLEETGVPYEIDHLAVVCENFFTGQNGAFEKIHCHCLEFYFVMKSRGSKKLGDVTSINADGCKEVMTWIPIEEFKSTNIKPAFLRDRIKEIIESKEILHIVTDQDKID